MNRIRYRRVASFKTPEAFRGYIQSLGIHMPMDSLVECGPASPLGRSIPCGHLLIGNRWCILPMEGWDGTDDGKPSEFTERRWIRFAQSGAKLIWGCEAVAVSQEGRSSPNQLWLHPASKKYFAPLRIKMERAHRELHGDTDNLAIGLQLTHSGRFSHPRRKDLLEPSILYHHPILDRRLGISPNHPILSDENVSRVIDRFIEAACMACECGFAFVDIKHCHGYLGHEFLSAFARPGRFGGSFENRTRFLREVVSGIRAAAPALEIAVRFSAFDTLPYRKAADGSGIPEATDGPYAFAFGCNPDNPELPDLREPSEFITLLRSLGIQLVCITAGSPYYNPHIQRPALFPPSDAYTPPEDPVVGVARMLRLCAELKALNPDMRFVASGLTYLQEYLPHVAQALVRQGWADFAGLGRMALAYPDLPADVLRGQPLQNARLCRTISDCTTAPRNGFISGCYPLDAFYRGLPEAASLRALKTRHHP